MTVTLFVIALVLGALLLLWHKQERILFQPPPIDEEIPEAGRHSYDAVDGQRLTGFMIGDPRQADGVLICFHGNADLSIRQIEWARLVERHTGFAVFLAEYRGYLSLGGSPTYVTTKLDARAAYDHIRITLGIDRSHVAFFGHSLGSAIATELAELHPPAALLLQSPFTSARAMARLLVVPPLTLVWKAISRIHFDTSRVVAELDVPVSVVHGKRDRLVPVRMGTDVYNAAKVKGEFLLVEEAGHNDVAQFGRDAYWQWMRASLLMSKQIVTG